MIQPIHRLVDRLLDNVGRYTLLLFLVLFTAPLGADDVISGKLDDERRRTSTHSVSVTLASLNIAPGTLNNSVDEMASPGSTTNYENTDGAASQGDTYSSPTSLASIDQQATQASWWQQNINKYARAELDRCGGVVSHWGEKESQTNDTQWIGTTISETGPPMDLENNASFLAGYDSRSYLPQVAEIKIPGLSPEKIYYGIHRKTASVRTPTGPPAESKKYLITANRPDDSAFDTSFVTTHSPFHYKNIFMQQTNIAAGDSYALAHPT